MTGTHHCVKEEPGVGQDDLPIVDILMVQHPCPCNLLVQQLRGKRREGGKGGERRGEKGRGEEGRGEERRGGERKERRGLVLGK